MKLLLVLIALCVTSCNTQYDGEIVVLSNGKVVQLQHHVGVTYIIEEIDSASTHRAALLMNYIDTSHNITSTK